MRINVEKLKEVPFAVQELPDKKLIILAVSREVPKEPTEEEMAKAQVGILLDFYNGLKQIFIEE